MEIFQVGTVEWDDSDLGRLVGPNVDYGAHFQLTYAEHDEGYYIEFKKPKYLSEDPLKLMCYIIGSGGPNILVELMFLGKGMFSMSFRGKNLLKKLRARGN
jgi:hypothetical protein